MTLAAEHIAAHPFWKVLDSYRRSVLAFGFKPTSLDEDVEAFFHRELSAVARKFQAEYPVMVHRNSADEERFRASLIAAVEAANCPRTMHVHGVETVMPTAEVLTFPGRQHDPMNTEQNGAA